jgi:hypothetical protein
MQKTTFRLLRTAARRTLPMWTSGRADGFPYLAEHAELHLIAPGDGGAREFEFGLA